MTNKGQYSNVSRLAPYIIEDEAAAVDLPAVDLVHIKEDCVGKFAQNHELFSQIFDYGSSWNKARFRIMDTAVCGGQVRFPLGALALRGLF